MTDTTLCIKFTILEKCLHYLMITPRNTSYIQNIYIKSKKSDNIIHSPFWIQRSEVHGLIILTSPILYTYIRGSWYDHISHPPFCINTPEVHGVIILHIPHSVYIHQRFMVWSNYTSLILYKYNEGHGLIKIHIPYSVHIHRRFIVWSHYTSPILYTYIRGSCYNHISHPPFCINTPEVHGVIMLHIPHSVYIH